MATDGGYRARMRERMAATIALHQPADVHLHCGGCAVGGELEDWPCAEARYAVTVQLMLEDRDARRQAQA